jgi:hypothetical protein
MGCVATINSGCFDFPKQGLHYAKRVQVAFHYDTSKTVGGNVVRDDAEEPWVTIILLDDGRYVLATECQYMVLNP